MEAGVPAEFREFSTRRLRDFALFLPPFISCAAICDYNCVCRRRREPQRRRRVRVVRGRRRLHPRGGARGFLLRAVFCAVPPRNFQTQPPLRLVQGPQAAPRSCRPRDRLHAPRTPRCRDAAPILQVRNSFLKLFLKPLSIFQTFKIQNGRHQEFLVKFKI